LPRKRVSEHFYDDFQKKFQLHTKVHVWSAVTGAGCRIRLDALAQQHAYLTQTQCILTPGQPSCIIPYILIPVKQPI